MPFRYRQPKNFNVEVVGNIRHVSLVVQVSAEDVDDKEMQFEVFSDRRQKLVEVSDNLYQFLLGEDTFMHQVQHDLSYAIANEWDSQFAGYGDYMYEQEKDRRMMADIHRG